MNLKQTGYVALILGFIVILVLAFKSEDAAADSLPFSPYVEINRTLINSELTMGGIGIRTNDYKWDLGINLVGEGDTYRGPQTVQPIYHISRIANTSRGLLGGQVYTGIGIAYDENLALVGNVNYKLQMGIRYDKLEVGIVHLSSGDIYDNNRGIDGVVLRILLN